MRYQLRLPELVVLLISFSLYLSLLAADSSAQNYNRAYGSNFRIGTGQGWGIGSILYGSSYTGFETLNERSARAYARTTFGVDARLLHREIPAVKIVAAALGRDMKTGQYQAPRVVLSLFGQDLTLWIKNDQNSYFLSESFYAVGPSVKSDYKVGGVFNVGVEAGVGVKVEIAAGFDTPDTGELYSDFGPKIALGADFSVKGLDAIIVGVGINSSAEAVSASPVAYGSIHPRTEDGTINSRLTHVFYDTGAKVKAEAANAAVRLWAKGPLVSCIDVYKIIGRKKDWYKPWKWRWMNLYGWATECTNLGIQTKDLTLFDLPSFSRDENIYNMKTNDYMQ